jgi:UDP-glucuronate 4-epimerase
MTRVVVTGAAGFIGSHLVQALVRRGDEVIGVDNFDAFYPRAEKEQNLAEIGDPSGFVLHEISIADRDALQRLLTPDTVLVHLAGKAGVRPSLADPIGYAVVNVAGTASVLDAARAAGVQRIVFASSSSVYGDSTAAPFKESAAAVDPVSPYAATKRAAELLLGSLAPIYGFRAAALRFFTVFGPRQRPDLAIHAFARRMAAGEPITLFGDGTQSRDYTYCDDITAGVVAAVDWTGAAPIGMEVFNLGGHHPVPLQELVSELSSALAIEPQIRWAPMQPGDVQHTYADLAKSGAALGFRPRTPFREGIRLFADWFRERHARQP